MLADAGCYALGTAAWVLHNAPVRLVAGENRRIKDLLAVQDRAGGILAAVVAILGVCA